MTLRQRHHPPAAEYKGLKIHVKSVYLKKREPSTWISERVERNPASRGKNGSKQHIAADGAGAHPVLALTGVKGHDVSQLER
jgi:hypothetical protein